MKYYHYIMASIACLLLTTSCSSDNDDENENVDNSKKSILTRGYWHSTNYKDSEKGNYVFLPDGTLEIGQTASSAHTEKYELINDDEIKLYSPFQSGGSDHTYLISNITENIMILQDRVSKYGTFTLEHLYGKMECLSDNYWEDKWTDIDNTIGKIQVEEYIEFRKDGAVYRYIKKAPENDKYASAIIKGQGSWSLNFTKTIATININHEITYEGSGDKKWAGEYSDSNWELDYEDINGDDPWWTPSKVKASSFFK